MVTRQNWLLTDTDALPTEEAAFRIRRPDDSNLTFHFFVEVFHGVIFVPTAGSNYKSHPRAGNIPNIEFLGAKARGGVLTGMYIVEPHARFVEQDNPAFTLEGNQPPTITVRTQAAQQDLMLPLLTWCERGYPVELVRPGLIDGRLSGRWLITGVENRPLQFENQADLVVRFNVNLIRQSI